MAPPQAVFHALMRPAIIQILRAAGFHSAKPTVIDSLTDIARRYLEILCQETARHTADNTDDPEWGLGLLEPTIVEVRRALQDVGAFLPEREWEEQDFMEDEDTRGVDDFVSWATGPKTELMKKIALDDGEEGVTDYLVALKKRHSKTADDSKYIGTLLGQARDQGHVTVEGGGDINSIQAWIDERRAPPKSPNPAAESRPASSGLSSVGTLADDEMDMSGP